MVNWMPSLAVLEGCKTYHPIWKALGRGYQNFEYFFTASDLLGSRYLLFPFCCGADRLAEVKHLVQGYSSGH